MIELHPDLSKLQKVLERIADSNERIADALDRAIPKYEAEPLPDDEEEVQKEKLFGEERNQWDEFAPRRNY